MLRKWRWIDAAFICGADYLVKIFNWFLFPSSMFTAILKAWPELAVSFRSSSCLPLSCIIAMNRSLIKYLLGCAKQFFPAIFLVQRTAWLKLPLLVSSYTRHSDVQRCFWACSWKVMFLLNASSNRRQSSVVVFISIMRCWLLLLTYLVPLVSRLRYIADTVFRSSWFEVLSPLTHPVSICCWHQFLQFTLSCAFRASLLHSLRGQASCIASL